MQQFDNICSFHVTLLFRKLQDKFIVADRIYIELSCIRNKVVLSLIILSAKHIVPSAAHAASLYNPRFYKHFQKNTGTALRCVCIFSNCRNRCFVKSLQRVHDQQSVNRKRFSCTLVLL